MDYNIILNHSQSWWHQHDAKILCVPGNSAAVAHHCQPLVESSLYHNYVFECTWLAEINKDVTEVISISQ